MIVKNEEAVLGRCLDCLQEIADEIIIVDTGSTDRTKEIAARYTDKIYDFQWVDDFAAARNASLRRATKDYVYIADADEVIDEENRRKFLLLKEAMLPEIDVVQMYYGNQLEYNTTYNYDVEYRPKLYKRIRELRFVDPIHESMQLTPIIYDSDIVITHMPSSNHAERDFKTFQKAIKNGVILSSKLFEMYAKELFIAGTDEDFLEAYDYFSGIAAKEASNDRDRKIYECVLSKIARIQNDGVSLMKYSLKNIAAGNPSSEVCYELGLFYEAMGDTLEAILWFYNAAFETEAELNIRYGGDFPLNQLSKCYYQLGDKEQGMKYQNLCEAWYQENMG